MKTRFRTVVGLVVGLLVGATATMQAQFSYTTSGDTVTITRYTGQGGDVVIPDTIEGLPVTSIGAEAFFGCSSLTSVTMPDSVTSIGDEAFSDCTSLASITIPDSVTSIGGWAFADCTSLTSIVIPDSVTNLGRAMFVGCVSLTSATVGNGVTELRSAWEGFGAQGNYTGAFQGCTGLIAVTLSTNLTNIGARAFYGCTSLTSIEIPDSITNIGRSAFQDCPIQHVLFNNSATMLIWYPRQKTGNYIIPEGVTSIAHWAFEGCTSLTSVVIPDSVTSIGDFAFAGCTGLTSIVIPDSVTTIEYGAFSWCTGLTSVTIGNGVTSIGAGAFSGCSGLTSVVIPDSVISIGHRAFEGCTSLTSIVIPDSVRSIESWAFLYCTSLVSVSIGKGLNSITAELFASCTKLASINISALNDAYSSFDGVVFNKDRTVLLFSPKGRNSIKIPPTVTNISNQALAGCWGLQAVYFYGDAPTMALNVFGETMATLFYVSGSAGWETTMAGRPAVEWNGLFGAHSLETYAGLTIVGEIGQVYSIEYVTDLTDPAESDWRCLEYLQLPASPYLWADKSAPATGKRFYRAVAMESPENMVFIPPGTFRMGSPEDEVDRSDWEGPQTAVTISRGYWMGKYEVTQGEYLEVMGENPSYFNGVRGEGEEWEVDYGTDLSRPVETVTWYDATEYCAKLTERERLAGRIPPNAVYRLPTEAEWEYACRATTSTRFSYGDDPGYTNLTNYAWYGDNSGGTTHPVGQKLPNAWGLHDVHGNAWEWCQDWWADSLPGGIVLDPQGPASGPGRVFRGGCRSYGYAGSCRSALRYNGYIPDGRDDFVGFRAVLAPGQ